VSETIHHSGPELSAGGTQFTAAIVSPHRNTDQWPQKLIMQLIPQQLLVRACLAIFVVVFEYVVYE